MLRRPDEIVDFGWRLTPLRFVQGLTGDLDPITASHRLLWAVGYPVSGVAGCVACAEHEHDPDRDTAGQLRFPTCNVRGEDGERRSEFRLNTGDR
jgi:hypothetical protein